MANQKQVDLLRMGVAVWNAWREKHPGVRPDLREASLRNASLREANLHDADLYKADLRFADLRLANLSSANLRSANIRSADLREANLREANLSEANLRDANLRNTDLRGANLSMTDLRSANLGAANLGTARLNAARLNEANFSAARLDNTDIHEIRLFRTIFAEVDLRMVNGLDAIVHTGPSFVDVKTVALPAGKTGTLFLRGAGFSDTFIDSLPSLLTANNQDEPYFISYDSYDEPLARRIYTDLQDKGVRCWLTPHYLHPGIGVDEEIHLHERTLLLLSEDAVNSYWVKHEVQAALDRELQQDRTILFPLRLDQTLLQVQYPWAVRLRESHHIENFIGWQDETTYQRRLATLLWGLRGEEGNEGAG